jgi:hypothetical protein
MMDMPFELLVGKTIMSIVTNAGKDEMLFKMADGSEFRMYHGQHCCESVRLEDVVGELGDVIASPILQAEVVSSPQGDPPPEYPDSWTWTFYKLATIKGSVTLRWLGESNGNYSESVDFVQTKHPTPGAEAGR